MDTLIHWVNLVVCAVLALALATAVLSPRVRDGIVMKLGLMSMSLGFAITAYRLWDGWDCSDLQAEGRALAMIHIGVLLAALSYALRSRGGRLKLRRRTDWAELTDDELERALSQKAEP
jgi:hypothetical protein